MSSATHTTRISDLGAVTMNRKQAIAYHRALLRNARQHREAGTHDFAGFTGMRGMLYEACLRDAADVRRNLPAA